jgi:tetratricopeptide (TPR) repeat protein
MESRLPPRSLAAPLGASGDGNGSRADSPLRIVRLHTFDMAVAVSSGFVGRGEELTRLLAALERAEQGQPAIVLLAGEAGIGKTRLVAELADNVRQRGVRILLGGCLQVGDVGLPYVPVIAALRGFAAEDDNDELTTAAKGLPALGWLLPELVDQPTVRVSLGQGLEQLQLFDAVSSLLIRLSQQAPVMLVVEDLHWLDSSTRELLAYLQQTLRGGRVLLLGSYRSDELHRRHPLWVWLAEFGRRPGVERMELGPLSRAELAEHLAALGGTRLSAAALERIFARSEGNPFYAEELLAAGAGDPEVVLPRALAAVLLGRVQALPDAAQQLLGVAAVAGRRVSHRLLLAAAGRPEPEVEMGLREAVTAHLLVADAASERYVFRHALLQEALYGDLLPSERVRLHATYARLLAEAAETSDHGGVPLGMGVPAAELAYHRLASHDLAGGLAASVQAAAEAEAVLAPGEALRHLEEALALWDQVPNAAAVAGADRVELVLRAAEAANATGAPEWAIALAGQAVDEIDPRVDPLRAARARERLAHHRIRRGHRGEYVRLCRQAVELVPEEPPTPLRARVTAALAQVLINTGQRDEARRWCQTALSVARAVGSTGDEADVLITLAGVENLNEVEKARSWLVEAQRRAAGSGHFDIELRAFHNLGGLEHQVGNLPAAWTAHDQGAERAEQVGLAWSPFGLALRGGRCLFRYEGGDWEASEALALAVDEQVAALSPELSANALPVEVGRGRPRVEQRLATLRSSDGLTRGFALQVAHYEAEYAMWQGDVERACSAIQRGLAVGDAVIWAPQEILLCAAGLAVQAARAEQARATGDAAALANALAVGGGLFARARAAVQPLSGSWHPNADPRNVHLGAWLAKAEAEATRLEGRSDPKAWQAAVSAFSFGHVYEIARCRWRLAEALLGSGQRQQAAEAARAAYQTALRLGGCAAAGSVGGVVPPRPPRPGYGW